MAENESIDMNEVVAEIKWTVQDIHDSFARTFRRNPSQKELEGLIESINTEQIEEKSIEGGWGIIDDFMTYDARDIIKDSMSKAQKKIMDDFDVSLDDFISLTNEICEGNPGIEEREVDFNEEIAYRLIEQNFDMHGFGSQLDGRGEIDSETNSLVMEAHSVILEEAANAYISGDKSHDDIQDFLDARLKENGLYQKLEEKGFLTDFIFQEKEKEGKTEDFKMSVYGYEPFGYEGDLVLVEADLRNGVPAFNIADMNDKTAENTRNTVLSAIKNSDLAFFQQRVLVGFSPADLRKTSAMNLAVATAILGSQSNFKSKPCLVIGELDESGLIRPVSAARAAVKSALAMGISNIICHPENVDIIRDIDGIKVFTVESLDDEKELFRGERGFAEPEKIDILEEFKKNTEVTYSQLLGLGIKEDFLTGYSKQCEAIEAAVAGRHNILLSGAHNSEKQTLAMALFSYLTPDLTYKEAQSVSRIHDIAGLMNTHAIKIRPPIRMPHQTSSFEGIFGGGRNVRPGEVSLAHGGVLLLDDVQEFKTTTLSFLPAPMNKKFITLSYAGRSINYPSDFQLVMTALPCPCGAAGGNCLCSERAKETYNKKLEPVTIPTEIKSFVQKDPKDTKKVSLEQMRNRIARAYEIQRERGTFNSNLSPAQILKLVEFTPEMNKFISEKFPPLEGKTEHSVNNSIRDRNILNAMRLSLTIANMDGRTQVNLKDLKKAAEMGESIELQEKKINKKLSRMEKMEMEREGR